MKILVLDETTGTFRETHLPASYPADLATCASFLPLLVSVLSTAISALTPAEVVIVHDDPAPERPPAPTITDAFPGADQSVSINWSVQVFLPLVDRYALLAIGADGQELHISDIFPNQGGSGNWTAPNPEWSGTFHIAAFGQDGTRVLSL